MTIPQILVYTCDWCGRALDPDDTVWVDKHGEATTGDNGRPYHVRCAPAPANFTGPIKDAPDYAHPKED